eukprot:NODE_6414_length_849_cov_79.885675_g6178_i0.p1 GENE.NODE_6414_length_849_cov_79.885675_g6178_i0~~NODE_6414_length_849_cov_79.885675_g6178_i0.p1  ORF type:complete len:192 (+),score=63.74 NODE_6414_length_849_cov_79.885675_g6178_i0:47-577(+)
MALTSFSPEILNLAVTNACSGMLQEAVAQVLVASTSVDSAIRVAFTSFTVQTPLAYFGQKFTAMVLGNLPAEMAPWAQLLWGNLVMTPFNVSVMVAATMSLQGKAMGDIMKALPLIVPYMCIKMWKIVPLAQLIIMKFVPMHLRVKTAALLTLLVGIHVKTAVKQLIRKRELARRK